jgi:hypothetical protein
MSYTVPAFPDNRELRLALKKIANRVDRGFNIDVRVAPPETTEAEEGEEADPEEAENLKYYEMIEAASENLQFLRLEGDPILSLPEKPEKSKKD